MTDTTLATTNLEQQITKVLTEISTDSLRHTIADAITRNAEVPTFLFPPLTDCKPILASKPKWIDREYRHAYMESAVEQTIAWQIKINREKRRLKQSDLAAMVGTTQSAISRAEDEEYGGHNLGTLVKIANAFDCALVVKFVSYSQLAYDAFRLSEDEMYACSYDQEISDDPTSLPLR